MAAACLIAIQAHLWAQDKGRDWQHVTGQSATTSREKWHTITKGEELVRGKSVQFLPLPDYHLTHDENDSHDLTDGTLSARPDDRIWFNKDAVGWMSNAAGINGALMIVDLGKVQPVGQIAVRALGGLEQDVLELPTVVEFMASTDGKQYYRLQKMVKLTEGEKEMSDFKTAFYIPEEGRAFMTPLICSERVRARYIAIRMRAPRGLFTDQISVLRAPSSESLKPLESFTPVSILPDGNQVFFDGFAVTPRYSPVTITTNIITPNWLMIQDNTKLKPSDNKIEFRIDVPKGLRILPQSRPAFKQVESEDDGLNSYLFRYDGTDRNGAIGPLYIERDAKAAIEINAAVTLTGIINGKISHAVRTPLRLVEIPEVNKSDLLDISLGWMVDGYSHQWPHFLRDFRKMGFNYVSTFPRAFAKDDTGKWNPHTQRSLDFLQQARKDGYKVLYNESPFHVMWSAIQQDIQDGKMEENEADQLFVQIDGQRGKHMNILYRGKYFQEEIKRVANAAALVQPDQIFLDIELWSAHVSASRNDPRVIQAWKKSGKSWEDFATDIGTEILQSLKDAVEKAVPQKEIDIGVYNVDPQNAVYTQFFEWKKLFPNVVGIAQPSLYVQGRLPVIIDRVRAGYDATGQRVIIPWLTTGTYGEFDPRLVEPMVLETILNGARGLTYFWFGDFDPMDFYYHSKALAMLGQFPQLLKDGRPLEYTGDNESLSYTAFSNGKQALLLVGNYKGTAKQSASLPVPFPKASSVRVVNGEEIQLTDEKFQIEVPPGEFRLLHIQ